MHARRRAEVYGTVQGVGFRPFVARLAQALDLAGMVRNAGRCVELEIEGPPSALDAFAERLVRELPAGAELDRIAWQDIEPRGEAVFALAESARVEGALSLTFPADLAPCEACLREVATPGERRYGYPFASCASCGPRFTIIEALPYDRARTTMAGFSLCALCEAEYRDPRDRRYHAQPIACPACGPRLVSRVAGRTVAEGAEALACASATLRAGRVIAVKGLGGFQLWVDATDEAAVARLRAIKRRPDEPFAVMVRDLSEAGRYAVLGPLEARALSAPSAPIVLSPRRPEAKLASGLAPGLTRLGLMLPSTPLHRLVLAEVAHPVVVTSANLHGEPMVLDELREAERLEPLAELVLGHDRAVARRCDDSVVQTSAGAVRTLRLGRGLGPLRMTLDVPRGSTLLCAGSHLANAPAALHDRELVLFPHVGDLDAVATRAAADEARAALEALLALTPQAIVADAHPDYASTRAAEARGLPIVYVHHHHAHVAACLAEHGAAEALGVAWDGVGLGEDATPWGGEILHVTPAFARRLACLRSFPLPGGDRAAREGLRALAGALAESGASPALLGLGPELARFVQLASSPRLSPRTTSAGRLFDAVAALLGVCTRSTYEGHAAACLEARATVGAEPLPFAIDRASMPWRLDWTPALRALASLREGDVSVASSRFHATLAALLAEALVALAAVVGCGTVALSGGCFANRVLSEEACARLRDRGLRVLLPRRVPPGDGGLALGQAWVAAQRRANLP